MSQIHIENAGKTFVENGKTFRALSSVNLDIEKGEFICLLGPSGCGKSTLLNAIAGFDLVNEGSITIDGKEVTAPSTRNVTIFQNYGLLPWRTVIKNVELGLESQDIDKKSRREKALKYLKMVKLESFANSFPRQLSGGMKQRATIARTLAPDPRIVLFDEPFSALDALTREKMQEHVHAIWKKSGKCFFFITHDVDEALTLSRRIIVMKADPGRIQADYKNPIGGSAKFSGSIRDVKGYREIREEIISMIQSKEDIEIMRLLKAV